MPLAVEIDTERRLVLVRLWGVLTTNDVVDAQERVRGTARFQTDYAMVADLAEVTEVAITPEELFMVVANSPFGRGAYRAYIIPRRLRGATAAAFEDLLDGMGATHRIFEISDDAYRWIETVGKGA